MDQTKNGILLTYLGWNCQAWFLKSVNPTWWPINNFYNFHLFRTDETSQTACSPIDILMTSFLMIFIPWFNFATGPRLGTYPSVNYPHSLCILLIRRLDLLDSSSLGSSVILITWITYLNFSYARVLLCGIYIPHNNTLPWVVLGPYSGWNLV